tara:strand:- start:58 stop:873 length:816 start_codon:yes stop_codon:yes gene_type:complete
MTPSAAMQRLLASKACDAAAHARLDAILTECPLAGRIIHGNRAADPEFGKLLSSDAWKRLSWVFGPDAFSSFLGQTYRGMCLTLGMPAEWIDDKLAMGTEFMLAIFPAAAVDAEPATWDGIEALLRLHYAEVWPKVEACWVEVKATPLAAIETSAGYDMGAVNLAGRDPMTGLSSDRRYISLKRLLAPGCGSLIEVRQFLWDEIGLARLFTGTGRTLGEDGEEGPLEYLARNAALASIDAATIVAIDPGVSFTLGGLLNADKGDGKITEKS